MNVVFTGKFEINGQHIVRELLVDLVEEKGGYVQKAVDWGHRLLGGHEVQHGQGQKSLGAGSHDSHAGGVLGEGEEAIVLEPRHAWKAPGSHRSWVYLLGSAKALRANMKTEVSKMVTSIMADPTMLTAVRAHHEGE